MTAVLESPARPIPPWRPPLAAPRLSPGVGLDALTLAARGFTAAEIGEHLGISRTRAVGALKDVYRTYRVGNAAAAVAAGFACGDLRGSVRPAPRLPRRRREILALVARGLPDTQIGRELWISAETVATHLRILFEEFGVHSRAALVCEAVRAGSLVPDAAGRSLVLAGGES